MSFRNACILALVICTSAGSLLAQDGKLKEPKRKGDSRRERPASKTSTKSRSKADAAPRRSPLSASQQNVAMSFARENHPELVPLINSLKGSRKADYNRALRELHSAAVRLGKMKERVPGDRYEQQLSLWKLDSRIKLQLAKWSVSPNKKLQADIREALAQKRAIQRQQYEQELLRAKERVAKMEAALERLDDANLDAEWARLARSVKRRKSQPKKSSKRKPDAKKTKQKPEKKP